MRREQIASPSDCQSDFEWLARVFHEISRSLQHDESGMPLVEVANFGLNPESAKKPPSTEPQYQFLIDPQLRSPAVQFVGNSTIDGIIRCVVTIQQVEVQPAHLHLPGAQPKRVARQLDLQAQPLSIGLT